MYPRATVDLGGLSYPSLGDTRSARTAANLRRVRLRPSGTGARVQSPRLIGSNRPGRPNQPVPRCHARALDDRRLQRISSASTSATATQPAGRRGVYVRCRSPAANGMARPAQICPDGQCPRVMPSSSVFCASRTGAGCTEDQKYVKALAVPLPAAWPGPETQAYNQTRALAAGDRGQVSGKLRCAGCFTPMAAAPSIECGGPLKSGTAGTRIRGICSVNRSADIHRLCGEALDRLGVAWRFSKPTTISVARREAVARLDEFVGRKY